MGRFWRESIGIGVSLALFGGIAAINFLASADANQYVGNALVGVVREWRLWLYGAVVAIFAAQQVILRFSGKRASLLDVDDAKASVEYVLDRATQSYLQELRRIAPQGDMPRVRMNVMLPTKRPWRFGDELKVYYWFGSVPELVYSEAELDLRWQLGKGACGQAWTKGRSVIYDSQVPDLKAPQETLDEAQRAAVSAIKCVISIPIWSRSARKVIGVLNCDSAWNNVDRTLFHHHDVATTIAAVSKVLSPMLPQNGVKPN